ncbi:MAG TPA: ABC transporter substrate-binding protein [Candidatus Binatia bacterium]
MRVRTLVPPPSFRSDNLRSKIQNLKQGGIVAIVLTFVLGGVVVNAQPPGKVYRIGALTNLLPTAPEVLPLWEAFRKGLGEHGWIEGKNIVIEGRYAEGRVERFPSLAAQLVSLQPDVIVAVTGPGARSAKQATSTIPVVMVYVLDPFEQGLVASLARPGGNVTGLTFVAGPEIVGKQLELLKEVVPRVSRVGVLSYPDNQSSLKEPQAAARALAVKIQPLEVRSADELEDAFAAMTRERAGALLVLTHPFIYAHARRIVNLAAKRRLPAMYPFRESVEDGGLMAYAANAPDMFRRAATYVDKILKGTKPADLPVEQPKKFDLVINLKAAKQIGLTIPPNVLARADKVIR